MICWVVLCGLFLLFLCGLCLLFLCGLCVLKVFVCFGCDWCDVVRFVIVVFVRAPLLISLCA